MDKIIEKQVHCAVVNITSHLKDETFRILFHSWAFVFPVVVVLVIISNFLLIFGICKTNKQLSSTNISFVWLSMQDIVVVFTTFVSAYINFIGQVSCGATFILNAINSCFTFSSMLTFCTISIFRYLKLKNPLKQIRSRIIYIVLIVEFMSAILTAASLITLKYIKYVNVAIMSGFVLFTGVLFILVLIIVLAINIKSYRIINKQMKLSFLKKVNNIDLGSTNKSSIRNTNLHSLASSKKLKSSVVTLIMITCSYLFCFTPFSAYMLISGLLEFHTMIKLYGLVLILSLLIHANSGINSIIFVIRSKNLRHFYTRCFRNKSSRTQTISSKSTIRTDS